MGDRLEILVHVSAACGAADDVRYREQATGFLRHLAELQHGCATESISEPNSFEVKQVEGQQQHGNGSGPSVTAQLHDTVAGRSDGTTTPLPVQTLERGAEIAAALRCLPDAAPPEYIPLSLCGSQGIALQDEPPSNSPLLHVARTPATSSTNKQKMGIVNNSRVSVAETPLAALYRRVATESWEAPPSIVEDSQPQSQCQVQSPSLKYPPKRQYTELTEQTLGIEAYDTTSCTKRLKIDLRDDISSLSFASDVSRDNDIEPRDETDPLSQDVQIESSPPADSLGSTVLSALEDRNTPEREVSCKNDIELRGSDHSTPSSQDIKDEHPLTDASLESNVPSPPENCDTPERAEALKCSSSSRSSNDLPALCSPLPSKLPSYGSEPTAVPLPAPETLPQSIWPPPPSTSDTLEYKTHATPSLKAISSQLSLSVHFVPRLTLRTIRPLERGYWKLHIPLSWTAALWIKFWNFLRRFIEGGHAGWGTWSERLEQEGSDSVGQHNGLRLGQDIRVWCWGEVVGEIWLVLYLASDRKVKGAGAIWVDGSGEEVLVMD